MEMKVCLIDTQRIVYAERMFYLEGLSLSRKYLVEVVGTGLSAQRGVKDGIATTCLKKRSKAAHLKVLVELFLHLRSFEFDVLECFGPDSLALVVLISRLLPRRPLIIYDAQEHFPSMMARFFTLPKALTAALQFLLDIAERFLAARCDAFVTVNNALMRRFVVFRKPIAIVRNTPSISWFDNAKTLDVLGNVRGPVVVCGGNLSWYKALDKLILSKIALEKRGIEVSFVLTGRVRDPSGRVDPYRDVLDRIFKVTGWLDYEDLPSVLRKAAIGLVLTKPISINQMIAEPMKLFAYMVAGLPVVATDLPQIRAIVAKENCGVLVDPNAGGEEIADAIARLLKDEETRVSMGKNARSAAEREYSWEKESERLLGLYRQLETSLNSRMGRGSKP
jgi:glycosyltransferase involved in cell wall biosynthesis